MTVLRGNEKICKNIIVEGPQTNPLQYQNSIQSNMLTSGSDGNMPTRSSSINPEITIPISFLFYQNYLFAITSVSSILKYVYQQISDGEQQFDNIIYKSISIHITSSISMEHLTSTLLWAKSHFLCAPTATAWTIYSIFYAYICLGSLVLPAKIVDGHPNPKRGPQLKYSINGFKLTCLTLLFMAIFGGVIPQLHSVQLFRMAIFADEFWPLWSVVNIFALVVSTLLYLKGTLGKSFLGEHVDRHTHGSFALDFWVGRQLNPRLATFDIKFVAYRVGMLWWLVLNFGFLAKQIQVQGSISLRMFCYQFATAFYVLDYFWNQEKMLTTWDIISEQFGHMLVFGDYVFIPFAFCVQCHYLVSYPDFEAPAVMVPVILALYFLGYYIFRTANSQKNQYKTNPTLEIWGEKPKTIGGKLLVSGFWGIGRHMNYTGDLIMALAYCLPCGLQAGGYFYAIYLFTLLTHRAYRDDTKCKEKYGKTWKEYCQKVPYVYVPVKAVDALLTGLGMTLYVLTNKDDVKEKDRKNNKSS